MPNSISNIKKLLGKRGFSGPVFIKDNDGNIKIDPDDGLPLTLTNKAGLVRTGFYNVQVDVDDINFVAKIRIFSYLSKKDFLRKPEKPELIIEYLIDDSDEIIDSNNAVTRSGTFSSYFGKDVVKTAGNCEQWKAIQLVLSLDGTSKFQNRFPINFTSGFSIANNDDKITQLNIDNA